MRGALLGGSALVLGGGAYVGGAFEQGEYYAMAPAAVEARLAGVQFGAELGPAEADKVKLVLRSRGPSLLRWDLMVEGERIASVRAKIAPDGAGTRVLTDFAFAKGDALMARPTSRIPTPMAAGARTKPQAFSKALRASLFRKLRAGRT